MEQNTFIVSPMSQFISLTPGQTYSGSIKVVNPSGSTADLDFSARVTPYSVIGQEYQADLATVSNFSQIVDWVQLDTPTGTIAPNSTAEIPFTITVPADAPAGGQYATIVVSQSSAVDSSISSVVGMASIIYADVAGETTHSGEVLDTSMPGFSFVTPVSIATTITNTGNVHETASVKLSVVNNVTGERIFPKSDQPDTFSEVIMPSSTRLLVRQLDGLPALGAVQVTQTVTYNGTDTTFSGVLVLCPVWFLALIAFTFFSIIFALVFRARSRRKSHQH
ncbi:MAG: hypothetical protein U0L97_04300 [Candidatus Saccharimonadaceae bacterium]|nr:hypothetical protein [Candidatus Saccharimonadaceae bacterium]